ncbi:MAG: hypothetical protein QNJ17_09640 [Desulfocapsaceae bacterium]|nr:hypothetical protein [Desulfocapsaceae bacterium]
MKIILVVGPSGSGKDTLLRSARNTLVGREEIGFARRYITRPPDGSEDNYYLDSRAFDVLKKCGFFISFWQAHQNYYGIGAYILEEVNGLETVICSVSRSAIQDFESRSEQTTTIEVTASDEILRARLLSRGRETAADVDKRLARARQPVVAKNHIIFDNSLPLEESCTRFTSLLLKAGAEKEILRQ